MGQPDIESALMAKFSTLGFTYVAYPNGPVEEIPATSMNFALSILYANADPAAIGASSADRYDGIFRVTIRVPLSQANANPVWLNAAYTAINTIMAAYKKGTSIGYPTAAPTTYVHCQVPKMTHIGSGVDKSWYSIVISIPWWSDIS